MAIPLYLAQTTAEMRICEKIPDRVGWMACHFSPYGTGLTNLPKDLPPHSLLILNDRTPIHGHDANRIFDQLHETVQKFQCTALLLDFQRRGCSESGQLAEKLLSLPCPVCVSESYAEKLECPVFLPPIPLDQTPNKYLQAWQGREIWLEAALDTLMITVTETGSQYTPLQHGDEPEYPHFDDSLLCHYSIQLLPKKAVFTLQRSKEDLRTLLEKVESHGVTRAVGLWQELNQ